MANKFNLEGFAVDTDGQCTADGGFVGGLTGDVITLPALVSSLTPALELGRSPYLLDATLNTVEATLADGISGQEVSIKCVNADNLTTVVPATFHDGTTITFTVNQSITLSWVDSFGWISLGNSATIS
jgi:hypothetical protein